MTEQIATSPIVIIEAIAMLLYILAIYIGFRLFKKSKQDFQVVFAVIMFALLIGGFVSLVDVLEWTGLGLAFMLAGMEEVLISIFAALWIIAAYTAIRRTRKTAVVTK